MSNANAIYGFVQKRVDVLDKDDPYSRAMCAKLRRAIGKHPGEAPDIWDITIQGISDDWRSRDGIPSPAEWSIHITLTLYALHRQGKNHTMNAKGITFGAAVGYLVRKDTNRLESIRRRFNTVATSTDISEIAYHIRGLVGMMRTEDISMDYPQLAVDLFYFQQNAEQKRLRWGEDFYKNITNQEETEGRDET